MLTVNYDQCRIEAPEINAGYADKVSLRFHGDYEIFQFNLSIGVIPVPGKILNELKDNGKSYSYDACSFVSFCIGNILEVFSVATL